MTRAELPGAPGPVRTPTPVGPARVQPPRRTGRIALATAAIAAVVAGIVVALVVLSDSSGDGTGGSAGGPPATSASAGGADPSTSSSGSGARPPAAAVAVGDCLDASGVGAACDAPHAAEVVATSGDCTPAQALSYLGGAPGQDVLRSDVTVAASGDAACVLTGPGAPWTGSQQDVLRSDDGDSWRRCVDEIGEEVPCDQPHTIEVFFEGTGAEDLACSQRADDYLDKPFAQVEDRLRLVPDGQRCLVQVRGDNVLTASLRRLGADALPLEAAAD